MSTCIQFPKRRPAALPFIVQRMAEHVGQSQVAIAALNAVPFGLMLQHHGSHQPGAQESGYDDAALIHPVAIHVAGAVVGNDGGEVRRARARGVPLAPAIIGLADHAELPGGPALHGDPLDHIVDRFAFLARDRVPVAFRAPAPRYVHRDISVTVIEIELHRAVFDECEDPIGGQAAERLLIGRCREQNGERSLLSFGR